MVRTTEDRTVNTILDTPQINVVDALSSKVYPIPSPTVAFVKPGHLETLVHAILKEARKSFLLYPFAWRHKMAGISGGFVTKESLWDRLVFDAARSRVAGDGAAALRAVIVSQGVCHGCFRVRCLILCLQDHLRRILLRRRELHYPFR